MHVMVLTHIIVSFYYIKNLAQSGCSGNVGSVNDGFYILYLSTETNEL